MPNHNSKIPEMISCLFWPFIFYLSLWHLQTFLIYALKQGRLNSIIGLRAKQYTGAPIYTTTHRNENVM